MHVWLTWASCYNNTQTSYSRTATMATSIVSSSPIAPTSKPLNSLTGPIPPDLQNLSSNQLDRRGDPSSAQSHCALISTNIIDLQWEQLHASLGILASLLVAMLGQARYVPLCYRKDPAGTILVSQSASFNRHPIECDTLFGFVNK